MIETFVITPDALAGKVKPPLLLARKKANHSRGYRRPLEVSRDLMGEKFERCSCL
jgi:hypothetical protein